MFMYQVCRECPRSTPDAADPKTGLCRAHDRIAALERDLAAARAEAAGALVLANEYREAVSRLQDVVADADSVGEMLGENKLFEPWATLNVYSEKYLGLLAQPLPERAAEVGAAVSGVLAAEIIREDKRPSIDVDMAIAEIGRLRRALVPGTGEGD